MVNKDKIIAIIYEAFNEINQKLPEEKILLRTEDTIILGKRGKLDSLGLVSLLILVEEKIEEQFNTTVTLADEKAMAAQSSPFRSVQTLAHYILKKIGE